MASQKGSRFLNGNAQCIVLVCTYTACIFFGAGHLRVLSSLPALYEQWLLHFSEACMHAPHGSAAALWCCSHWMWQNVQCLSTPQCSSTPMLLCLPVKPCLSPLAPAFLPPPSVVLPISLFPPPISLIFLFLLSCAYWLAQTGVAVMLLTCCCIAAILLLYRCHAVCTACLSARSQ